MELDSRILRVFLPAVANLLLLPLVGAADLFWVGRTGDPLAIAGMGAANQVYSTIYFMSSFLPALVTPEIARVASKGNLLEGAQFVREALAFAAAIGLLGCTALVVFPVWVLASISSDPAVLATAVPYLRWRGISLIPTLWSTIGFATFRGLLDTRTPFKIALVVNLLNVVLDPVLMFGLGLGAAGAAAATSASEVLSVSLFLLLLRRSGYLDGVPAFPSWRRLRSLMQSGLAVQVRSLGVQVMFIAAVRRVTTMDPSGVQAAAYQVTLQFWNLGGYVLIALGTAGSGMVPTALGRGGVAAAREVADRLSLWGWTLGVVLCLFQLLTLPLVQLMTPVVAVQKATRLPSFIAALLQIVVGAVFAGEGTLMGLRAYSWLACSSSLGCLLMLCILAATRDLGVAGVWIGFFAFNLVRLLFSVSHRFRFGPLARKEGNCEATEDSGA